MSYTAGQGWICPATVSSDANNQSTVTWSANQLSGVSFNPVKWNSLLQAKRHQLTIAISDMACPANATFTFSGSGGATPASITWSCVAPVMAVSSGVTCPGDGNGNYTCTFTLALVDGSQGDMNWSVSNSLVGSYFQSVKRNAGAGPTNVGDCHSFGQRLPRWFLQFHRQCRKHLSFIMDM